MNTAHRKWHHKVLGTVDDRRRWRDVALRRLGLARTRVPMELVRRRELELPNVVRGMAAELLLRQQRLTFVQVGAFDGQSDDDLTTLLPLDNVRGVLIEPQPEPFAKLNERFAHFTNLALVNAAIARESGEKPFYRPKSGASRLASFDRNNLLRHGVAAKDIICQPVRCLPLDQLLAELGYEQLDVLQIDAEGYDLEVLATLDLEHWQPAVVRIEFLHLPPRQVDALVRKLSPLGYRFLIQERDLVACRCAESNSAAA